MEDTNWEVEQEPLLNCLEKGSEDWVLFHTLVQSTPGFLSLSAAKVKKKYHQFSKYHTTYLNSFIQNARKAHRKKEEASKKSVDKEEEGKKKSEPTDEERSKWFIVKYILKWFLVSCFIYGL